MGISQQATFCLFQCGKAGWRLYKKYILGGRYIENATTVPACLVWQSTTEAGESSRFSFPCALLRSCPNLSALAFNPPGAQHWCQRGAECESAGAARAEHQCSMQITPDCSPHPAHPCRKWRKANPEEETACVASRWDVLPLGAKCGCLCPAWDAHWPDPRCLHTGAPHSLLSAFEGAARLPSTWQLPGNPPDFL